MALKKSDLYSSLWASCDELRGGMDASQYKDYVLFMLFIKYVTDKYGNSTDFASPVTIPKGASFKEMLELRGKSDIGDKINTQVIAPLVNANARLARSDFPDFNDSNKLGEGQAKVERLTNLINIFATPQLDFSQNRAEHDDILGDAYEYLMRHFATESGKSKGQFYTPAEVSHVIAKVFGISPQNTRASTTAYDPTCGSGSLLLKVAAEAGKHITLEGQEKDVTTAGLARISHSSSRSGLMRRGWGSGRPYRTPAVVWMWATTCAWRQNRPGKHTTRERTPCPPAVVNVCRHLADRQAGSGGERKR